MQSILSFPRGWKTMAFLTLLSFSNLGGLAHLLQLRVAGQLKREKGKCECRESDGPAV